MISAFTLTESSTDCANTSTAMPRLKKGCCVMSYILARKPPFSVREIKDQRFITQLEQNVSAEMFLLHHYHTVRVVLSVCECLNYSSCSSGL